MNTANSIFQNFNNSGKSVQNIDSTNLKISLVDHSNSYGTLFIPTMDLTKNREDVNFLNLSKDIDYKQQLTPSKDFLYIYDNTNQRLQKIPRNSETEYEEFVIPMSVDAKCFVVSNSAIYFGGVDGYLTEYSESRQQIISIVNLHEQITNLHASNCENFQIIEFKQRKIPTFHFCLICF